MQKRAGDRHMGPGGRMADLPVEASGTRPDQCGRSGGWPGAIAVEGIEVTVGLGAFASARGRRPRPPSLQPLTTFRSDSASRGVRGGAVSPTAGITRAAHQAVNSPRRLMPDQCDVLATLFAPNRPAQRDTGATRSTNRLLTSLLHQKGWFYMLCPVAFRSR